MIFYLDVFFAINFIADLVLLFCAARMGGVRVFLWRMLLGAGFGAVYACLCVFWPVLGALPAKLLALALLNAVAFGIHSRAAFLRRTLLLYVMAALLGGLAYQLLLRGGSWAIVLLTAFSGTLISVMLISDKLKKVRSSDIVTLTVYKKGQSYRLSALLDSGNTCVDPVSGLPIILCEDVFAEEKCRIGTYHTASGEGTMKLFLPQSIYLNRQHPNGMSNERRL